MPTDVGGYQAADDVVAEVLAQISRGCPSTGWMSTIMLVSNLIPRFWPMRRRTSSTRRPT
jgi:hypothetical protein